MPKFKVKFNGRHFRMQTSEKRLFGSRTIWKNVGFYTTRFVEAEDDDAAISSATAYLEKELTEKGMYTGSSILEPMTATLDDAGYDANAPGSGFTFYCGDEDC